MSEKIAGEVSITIELKADEVKKKENDSMVADELAQIEKDNQKRKAKLPVIESESDNYSASDFERDEEPVNLAVVTPSKPRDSKVDSLVEEALQLSAQIKKNVSPNATLKDDELDQRE